MNNQCEMNTPPKDSDVYYGVYLSPEFKTHHISKDNLVLSDKSDTVKLVKKYKGARFKRFNTYCEAYDFVKNGLDNSSGSEVSSPVILPTEKLIPHKAPRPQDLVKLRKSIEANDIITVKKMVEENPRFLISSGDTPSILQEGPRYNALHCAARASNGLIASYILDTISSIDFFIKLYGYSENDLPDNLHERCCVLVDLFLNTPDKSLNETPLHFASKLGSVEVVEVLLSYPQCKRTQRNKFDQTPLDIVCCRTSSDNINLKKKIIMLIADSYYVPVLRSEDISIQAAIGDPFTLNSQQRLNENERSQCNNWNLSCNVKAVAGPMDEATAIDFRKKWKSKCRSSVNQNKVLVDTEKGLETIGRDLASELDVEWTEYWSFLDIFIDLRSQQGLFLLEEFLRKRFRQSISSSASCNVLETSPFCTDDVLTLCPEPVSSFSFKTVRHFNSCGFSKLTRNPKQISNTVPITNPLMQIEKMCQEFARRLTRTILSGSKKGINTEINHIQNYIISCADDPRFKNIELNKIHCRLARACFSRLSNSEKDGVLPLVEYYMRVKSTYMTPKMKNTPLYCIFSFLLQFLTNVPENDPVSPQSDDWAYEEICSCDIPSNIKNMGSRRVLFPFNNSDDNPTLDVLPLFEDSSTCTSVQLLKDVLSDESSEDESDTSDPELECYYTPPTSPAIFPDDSEEECELMTPDEGPNVFITGDNFTKVDGFVLEALSNTTINPLKYPNILHWKHICETNQTLPAESWPTPPSQPVLMLRRQPESQASFTPPWHPSKLLLYHHKKIKPFDT